MSVVDYSDVSDVECFKLFLFDQWWAFNHNSYIIFDVTVCFDLLLIYYYIM